MASIDTYSAELRRIAESRSTPFCYSCYVPAPTGRCAQCHSDDLMRLVPGVGVEYGLDWVVTHIFSSHLQPADVNTAFEESVAGAYPETVQIGWIVYDIASAIKELDPVSWEMAKSEWIDGEVENGTLVTFDSGGTYYWTSEVDTFVDEHCDDDYERSEPTV